MAVEDGTNAGSTSVGWAGVATHVEGDTLTAPGGTTTTAAPVVLVAGDDGANVIPLQMSGADLKVTLDSEAVVLGAGTAAIGKLAANSGVDIGDVDVLSLPALASGTNTIGKLGANSGVDIGDVDVTSVSGTVTVDNGGTFAVQVDGAALTALQLIDDVVYADDADWNDGTSKHILVGGLYQSAPQTITDGDVGPLEVDANGYLKVSLEANPVGVAGSTAYTEDVASANPIVGTATMMERDDQLSALTPVEGDWVSLRSTGKGALWVSLADASGDPITSFGGGTEYTEDVATANPQVGKAIMVERDDALTTVSPVEGDWIGLRGTAEGALWVQDFNSDAILADTANIDTNIGTIAGAVAGSEMQVDVVAALPAGTNAIGKLAANSGVDIGDVDILSIAAGDNNIGNVDIASALPAGTNAIGKLAANSGVDIGDVDVTSITGVTMSNAAMQITGDEAHDAADAGNPVKVGGKANTNEPTAVADADRVDMWLDRYGRPVIIDTHPNPETCFTGTITAATNGELIAAPGASQCIYVTGVQVSNSDSNMRVVYLTDGVTDRKVMACAANGGGYTATFRPFWRLTANANLQGRLDSASGTTYVNIDYFVMPAP
jgi:hypothetical protein